MPGINGAMRFLVVAILFACTSKSEQKPAPAPSPPSQDAASAPAVPSEPAAVKGPTRSGKGALTVSGAMTGTFEWKKKDQTDPISCAWNAEKEIGGLHIDLSDGAGQLITLNIDAPPKELGKPRLDVISVGLPGPLKTYAGFKMSGDDAGHIQVTFDTTLTQVETDPDAPKKPAKKGEKKPSGPQLTIKGTLEVNCPPKK